MAVPRSLAEVGAATTDTGFVDAMKEFIDVVIAHARSQDYRLEGPLPLPQGAIDEPPRHRLNRTTHAYLCAMAEHLAGLAGIVPPAWSLDPEGFLDHPVFQGGPRSRDSMLKDTPPAFRRRLVFFGPVLLKLELLRKRET